MTYNFRTVRKARMQATELARERDTMSFKAETLRNELEQAKREVANVLAILFSTTCRYPTLHIFCSPFCILSPSFLVIRLIYHSYMFTLFYSIRLLLHGNATLTADEKITFVFLDSPLTTNGSP